MKVYFIALIATLITPLAFSSSTRTTLNDAVNLVFEEPFILAIEADKPLHIAKQNVVKVNIGLNF